MYLEGKANLLVYFSLFDIFKWWEIPVGTNVNTMDIVCGML